MSDNDSEQDENILMMRSMTDEISNNDTGVTINNEQVEDCLDVDFNNILHYDKCKMIKR